MMERLNLKQIHYEKSIIEETYKDSALDFTRMSFCDYKDTSRFIKQHHFLPTMSSPGLETQSDPPHNRELNEYTDFYHSRCAREKTLKLLKQKISNLLYKVTSDCKLVTTITITNKQPTANMF